MLAFISDNELKMNEEKATDISRLLAGLKKSLEEKKE